MSCIVVIVAMAVVHGTDVVVVVGVVVMIWRWVDNDEKVRIVEDGTFEGRSILLEAVDVKSSPFWSRCRCGGYVRCTIVRCQGSRIA